VKDTRKGPATCRRSEESGTEVLRGQRLQTEVLGG